MFYLDNVKQWLDKNKFSSLDFDNIESIFLQKKSKIISLIIPTLNEEKTIGSIIEKIFNELNSNFKIIDELIIIDGGSSDNTLKIIHKLKKI